MSTCCPERRLRASPTARERSGCDERALDQVVGELVQIVDLAVVGVRPLEGLEFKRGVHLRRLGYHRAERHLLRGFTKNREPVRVDGDHRGRGHDEHLRLTFRFVVLKEFVFVTLRHAEIDLQLEARAILGVEELQVWELGLAIV
eukprot:scaffold39787_cov65-Phaeocystis_antarctica.AAC.6